MQNTRMRGVNERMAVFSHPSNERVTHRDHNSTPMEKYTLVGPHRTGVTGLLRTK